MNRKTFLKSLCLIALAPMAGLKALGQKPKASLEEQLAEWGEPLKGCERVRCSTPYSDHMKHMALHRQCTKRMTEALTDPKQPIASVDTPFHGMPTLIALEDSQPDGTVWCRFADEGVEDITKRSRGRQRAR